MLSINLNEEHTKKATLVFNDLGLSISEAINMFLAQVTLDKSLPFDIHQGKKATIQAFKDAQNNINLEHTSLEEMIEEHKLSSC